MVIGTDCISSYKGNYHTITTTAVPNDSLIKEHRDFTCWVIVGFKILFILFSARSLYWMWKLSKYFLKSLLILQNKKKWDSSSITLHVLHNVKLRGILFSYLPVTQRYHHPCNRYHTLYRVIWFDILCLTPLSAIFQLYHGDQFLWWKKPEYLERTTDHGQATGKLYHLRLRVECSLFCNLQSRARTHVVFVIGLYEL